MGFNYTDRQRLVRIENNQHVLDQHLNTIERMLIIMARGMDELISAVDEDSTTTDALSDSVAVLVDWVRNHEHENLDPELLAIAARVRENNTKSVAATDAVVKILNEVSASGGPATP